MTWLLLSIMVFCLVIAWHQGRYLRAPYPPRPMPQQRTGDWNEVDADRLYGDHPQYWDAKYDLGEPWQNKLADEISNQYRPAPGKLRAVYDRIPAPAFSHPDYVNYHPGPGWEYSPRSKEWRRCRWIPLE